jgi:hypothetical protein
MLSEHMYNLEQRQLRNFTWMGWMTLVWLGVSMGRVGPDSDRIILFYYFFIRFHMYKIIKYLFTKLLQKT